MKQLIRFIKMMCPLDLEPDLVLLRLDFRCAGQSHSRKGANVEMKQKDDYGSIRLKSG